MSFDPERDTFSRQSGFLTALASASTTLFNEVLDVRRPMLLTGLRVFSRDAAAPERVAIRLMINGVRAILEDFTGWDRTGGEAIPWQIRVPAANQVTIQAVNADAVLNFDLAIHVFGRPVS